MPRRAVGSSGARAPVRATGQGSTPPSTPFVSPGAANQPTDPDASASADAPASPSPASPLDSLAAIAPHLAVVVPQLAAAVPQLVSLFGSLSRLPEMRTPDAPAPLPPTSDGEGSTPPASTAAAEEDSDPLPPTTSVGEGSAPPSLSSLAEVEDDPPASAPKRPRLATAGAPIVLDDGDASAAEGRDDGASRWTPSIDPDDSPAQDERPGFVYDLPAELLAAIFPEYKEGAPAPSFFRTQLAKHDLAAILKRYPAPANCPLRLYTPEAVLPAQAAKGKSVPSDREFAKTIQPLTDVLRPCLLLLAGDASGSSALSHGTRSVLLDMVRLTMHHLACARQERVKQTFGSYIPGHVVSHATAPRTARREESLCDQETVDALQKAIKLSASIVQLRASANASKGKVGKPRAPPARSFRPNGAQQRSNGWKAPDPRYSFRAPRQFNKGPHDTGREPAPRGPGHGQGATGGGRRVQQDAA